MSAEEAIAQLRERREQQRRGLKYVMFIAVASVVLGIVLMVAAAWAFAVGVVGITNDGANVGDIILVIVGAVVLLTYVVGILK